MEKLVGTWTFNDGQVATYFPDGTFHGSHPAILGGILPGTLYYNRHTDTYMEQTAMGNPCTFRITNGGGGVVNTGDSLCLQYDNGTSLVASKTAAHQVDWYQPGRPVTLCGLQNNGNLNGQQGTIRSYDMVTSRFVVELQNGNGTTTVTKIRDVNLKPLVAQQQSPLPQMNLFGAQGNASTSPLLAQIQQQQAASEASTKQLLAQMQQQTAASTAYTSQLLAQMTQNQPNSFSSMMFNQPNTSHYGSGPTATTNPNRLSGNLAYQFGNGMVQGMGLDSPQAVGEAGGTGVATMMEGLAGAFLS